MCQIERLGFDGQLARLHLGIVQHIGQKPVQHLAGGCDQSHLFGDIARQIFLTQGIRHSHHAIQGGADFVTDIGKELGASSIFLAFTSMCFFQCLRHTPLSQQ